MGKRGPPAQPIELRLLRGNPGRRPIPATLRIERLPAPPEPLEFLSAYAQEEWRRLAPELSRLGVLSRLDLGSFGAYCESYSVWRRAVEALARVAANDPLMHGLLVKRDGEAVPNPLVRIARQAADAMVRVAGEFGATPAARARLAAGPSSERPDEEFAGLLA